MDFVCDICSCIGNSFIFDKIWWKDYGIPLIGTIGVPFVVWLLTRYYGADKAEERKEKKELRDNLNLLLSVLSTTFDPLIDLKKQFQKLQEVISLPEKEIDSSENFKLIGTRFYLNLPILDTIIVEKYSPCIKVEENYVIDIIKIVQGSHIISDLLKERNHLIEESRSCGDNKKDAINLIKVIIEERMNNERRIMYFNELILKIKELVDKTTLLPKKIKGLDLEIPPYEENAKKEFEKAKQELEEYNRKILENK